MTIDECIDYAEEQSEWMSKPKYAKIDIYKDKSEYYRQLAEWLRELKELKVLFVKANRDVGNVHLDNRAIFEKFFWEVWKILDVKGLEEVNADEM